MSKYSFKDFEKDLALFATTRFTVPERELLDCLLPTIEKRILQNYYKVSISDLVKITFKHSFRTMTASLDSTAGKQVIFWPFQFIHLDFLVPVYKELASQGTGAAFVCLRDEVRERTRLSNMPILEAEIGSKWGFGSRGLQVVTTFWSLVGKARMASRNFAKAILAAYTDLNSIIDHIALYQAIAKDIKPSFHLVGYDMSLLGRVINSESKKDAIPVGNIQHGCINYLLSPFSKVDYHFLWDSLSADFYQKKGVKGQVHKTGSPAVHHYMPSPIGQQLPAFLKDNFKGCNKVGLVCFSGPGHNISEPGHLSNLAAMEGLVASNPELGFLIKLHPKDKPAYYSNLVAFDNVVLVEPVNPITKLPIHQYLATTDFLLTGASTVSLEAFMENKPVVCLDCLEELNHVEFLQSGMVYTCHTAEALSTAFESIKAEDLEYHLKMKLITQYADEMAALHTDNPPATIAHIIEQVVSQKAIKQPEIEATA